MKRFLIAAFAMITLLLAIGCTKKPPTPAAPPPAPTTTQTPVPTPTPTPAPAPSTPAPAPPQVGSGDFKPVFFDYDAYTLNDAGRAALDADAKVLRENATANVTVEGHCDERGTTEYNQALGERRAQAARDYLTAAGIAAARLTIVSYGKERPFDMGHDEKAWAQNRRAHFTVR